MSKFSRNLQKSKKMSNNEYLFTPSQDKETYALARTFFAQLKVSRHRWLTKPMFIEWNDEHGTDYTINNSVSIKMGHEKPLPKYSLKHNKQALIEAEKYSVLQIGISPN